MRSVLLFLTSITFPSTFISSNSPSELSHWSYDELLLKYSYVEQGPITEELLKRPFNPEAAQRVGSQGPIHRVRMFIMKHNEMILTQQHYYVNGTMIQLNARDEYITLQNRTEHSANLKESISSDIPRHKTIYKVIDMDTITAALLLQDNGYNAVALNMANQYNPGGGYEIGAVGQEEEMFRKTGYVLSLQQDRIMEIYKTGEFPDGGIGEFGVVYSPDVPVIRGEVSQGYPLLKEVKTVSFIACAMYQCNRVNFSKKIEGVKEKVRVVLRMAHKKGHNAVVLSAWGSGAFQCPVEPMAMLTKIVLLEEEFDGVFQVIMFAITAGRRENIEAYHREFADLIS